MTDIEMFKKLFCGTAEEKTDCRIELLARQVEDVNRLRKTAMRRYEDGEFQDHVTKDGQIISVKKFDTSDGNLALNCIKEVTDNLGIESASKVEWNDISEGRPFSGMTTEELENGLLEEAERIKARRSSQTKT